MTRTCQRGGAVDLCFPNEKQAVCDLRCRVGPLSDTYPCMDSDDAGQLRGQELSERPLAIETSADDQLALPLVPGEEHPEITRAGRASRPSLEMSRVEPTLTDHAWSSACLSVTETASHLSLGRTTVYSLLASGELDSVKIGRSRRVPVAAIADFVHRQLKSEPET